MQETWQNYRDTFDPVLCFSNCWCFRGTWLGGKKREDSAIFVIHLLKINRQNFSLGFFLKVKIIHGILVLKQAGQSLASSGVRDPFSLLWTIFGGAPTQLLTFSVRTYVCTYVRPKHLYLHCMRQNVLNFNVQDSSEHACNMYDCSVLDCSIWVYDKICLTLKF